MFLSSVGQRGDIFLMDPLNLTLMKSDFVSSEPLPAGRFTTKSQIPPRVRIVMPLSSRNRVLVVSQDHVPLDLVTRRNTYDKVGPNDA